MYILWYQQAAQYLRFQVVPRKLGKHTVIELHAVNVPLSHQKSYKLIFFHVQSSTGYRVFKLQLKCLFGIFY